MTVCAGCNHENSDNTTKKVDRTTEVSSYKNGTIMIKDNTIYRDYGNDPESFDNVIETEKNTVDVKPNEIQFGK